MVALADEAAVTVGFEAAKPGGAPVEYPMGAEEGGGLL